MTDFMMEGSIDSAVELCKANNRIERLIYKIEVQSETIKALLNKIKNISDVLHTSIKELDYKVYIQHKDYRDGMYIDGELHFQEDPQDGGRYVKFEENL